MQEEEVAGFVPAVGNLWLAAPEHTHTLTHTQTQAVALLLLAFVSCFFFYSSCGAAELRSDLIKMIILGQNQSAKKLRFLVIIPLLCINIPPCVNRLPLL